jgi:AraC family transcriptional regulator of arabinose operon
MADRVHDGGFSGYVAVNRDRGAYFGLAGRGAQHSIHTVKVVVALETAFMLETPYAQHEMTSAVVPSEMPHAIVGKGAPLAILYLVPESREAHPLARAVRGLQCIATAAERRFRAPLRRAFEVGTRSERDGVVGELLGALSPARSTAIDPRIADVLDAMQSGELVALTDMARRVGLSPTRLTHLFAEETGVSYKRFALWERLRQAFNELPRTESLSTIADRFGFADAAHFSRTFHGMLGMTPSHLRRRVLIDVS